MENSERLGRQTRPGFEPGTSRLHVLSVTAVRLMGRFTMETALPLLLSYYIKKKKKTFSQTFVNTFAFVITFST